MKKRIFFAAAVIFSSTLQAQDTTDLNPVVITATRFPIKQSLTGKVLSIITSEQLEKNSGRTLTEVLNMQAGIIINGTNSSPGSVLGTYMRGAATGKTLILIDGIPAYDASGISGEYDLNFIALDQVERIEVLKGSQSTLYGSDAVAGVINIITKKGGAKKINGNVNLAAGSYGTFKTGVGVNGTAGKTNYNVQFNTINSAGFSSAYDASGVSNFDKDGYDQAVVRATVNQKVNNKLNLHLTTQFSKYKADVDAGTFTDDKNYTITIKNALAGIGADYAIGKTTLRLNYNYNTTERKYFDDSTQRADESFSKSKYIGKSHFIEAYSNISINDHVDILVGADYRNQITEQEYLSIHPIYGPYSTAIGDTAKVNQFGAYASVIVKDVNGFNLEVGSRYNNFNKYGDVFTFSFNPSYNINKQIKLFANVASGFKAPSLYQVYGDYKPRTGELNPEKSLSFEAGAQYVKENVKLRAVYFVRNLKDNIIFFDAGPPTYDSYYINADKQKDKGFELEATVKFGTLTLSANYTNLDGFIETKNGNKDTAFFNLYRRPRQVINLSAGIQVCKALYLNFGVQSIGKRFEAAYMAPPSAMPSYTVWNAYADYKIGKRVKLFADFKNITDEQYFESSGFNTRRFNVMAGATLNF